MMKLITGHQKDEWDRCIKGTSTYDFYHTWHYHSLDKSGQPLLFVFQQKADYIAFPFIKRVIPDSSYFDLSCVYGYTGPVSNKKFEDLDERFVDNFKRSFISFLKKAKVVTVFSRLNPFSVQNLLMQKFGSLYQNGKTVAIDLQCSIESQRGKYRKSFAKHIRKSLKAGYQIKESIASEDIDLFYDIYSENMKRVGSKSFYLFDKPHFQTLLKSRDVDCRLVLLCLGEKVICGQIIGCTNGLLQAYLMGTAQGYLKESPAKFLIDQISIIGRNLGMKYYHLGGGLGFSNDSLFDWKAGFSDLFIDYSTWRYVANKQIYNHLVNRTGNEVNRGKDFFPLYRFTP